MVFLPLCSLVYCGPFARIYELVECFRMLSHAHSHVPLTIPESHGGARILSPAALSRSFPQAPLVRCLHSIDIIPLTLLPFFCLSFLVVPTPIHCCSNCLTPVVKEVKDLAAPENRVLFAGEATSDEEMQVSSGKTGSLIPCLE